MLKDIFRKKEKSHDRSNRRNAAKQKGKIFPERNDIKEPDTITDNPPWALGVVQQSFSRLIRFNRWKEPSIPSTSEANKADKKKKVEFDSFDQYWRREEYGGLTIWVNEGSRDVSVEYPVLNEGSKQRSMKKKVDKEPFSVQSDNESTKRLQWQEIHKAQEASRKYNNPEMQELFDMIDCRTSSRRIDEIVKSQKRNQSRSQIQKMRGQKYS